MIALGLVLGLSACGEIRPHTKPLGMLSVSSRIPAERRWAYLQSSLTQDGWKIQNLDSAATVLVAFKTEPSASDLRERLVVQLGPTSSAAMVQSELRVGDTWQSTPVVCASYSYARERQIVAGMEASLASIRSDESSPIAALVPRQE